MCQMNDLWTECPWAMPKFNEQNCHPFQFKTIAHCQSLDDDLMNSPTINHGEFTFQKFGSHDLVCCTTGIQHCIALMDNMLPCIVMWYHLLMAHVKGMVQLKASLQHHFLHTHLRDEICQQLGACATCAEMKKEVLNGTLAH